MNRQPKHWVLVADSGQARILELQRKPYEFRLVSELVSATQHQTTKELISDASGRVYSSKGAGTHAMAPRADPHDLAEDQSARWHRHGKGGPALRHLVSSPTRGPSGGCAVT
jgi:hypothetical protein